MSNFAESMTESNRLLHNLISEGEVIEVDPAKGKMRLKINENESDWVAIPTMACGALKVWRCPTLGEQFVVVAESGNLGNAKAIASLATDNNPYPSNDQDQIYIDFGTGTFVLNIASGEATFTLNKLTFDVPQTKFTGEVHAEKEIKSDVDVKALTISLTSHKHIGVQSGLSSTGLPQ